MGLMSIAKIGWRALKLVPEMAFGTSAEVFGQGVKNAGKGASIWNKVKSGAKAVEADVANQAKKGGGGLLKRTAKSLWNLPKDLYYGARKGIKYNKVINRQLERKLGPALAKQLGKGSFKGALSGIGKVIGKRLPFIGVILTAIFDGPKIYDAFKNRGVGAGLKECAGVGTELGCMAAGAAIGSCFVPPIGTIVGGLAGAFVGMFARSYIAPEPPEPSEQPENGAAIAYNEKDVQELKQLGLSDEEIAYAQQSGLTVDDIKKFIGQAATELNDATRVQKSQIYEPIPKNEKSNEQTQQVQKSQAERMKDYQNQMLLYTRREKPDYSAMLQDIYANVSADMGIKMPSTNQSFAYQTPSISNSYSNDMMYKQTFGSTGSNPFSAYQTPYQSNQYLNYNS